MYEHELEIDAGLFLDESEGQEETRRNQGTALRAGDRIVLCSDGLIKTRHNAPGRYVEDRELQRAVTRHAPDKAAKELLQLALDRGVDDNVSVIVIEMPGSKRAFHVPRRFWIAAAGLLGLFLALVLVIALFRPGDQSAPGADVADVALIGELAATVTARPTALPCTAAVFAAGRGAVGMWGDNPPAPIQVGNDIPIGAGTAVQSGEGVLELVLSDGTQLYLDRNSLLELEQVAGCGRETETRLVLKRGRVLAELAGAQGHSLVIENALGGWAALSGGILGLTYSDESMLFEIDCFLGPCSLHDIGGERTYGTGEGGRMDSNGVPSEPVSLRSEQFCGLAVRLVPCPTATATGEPTEPPTATFTPVPTLARSTSTPRPMATPTLPADTPQPGATATPRPANTSTPGPAPTNLPEPSATPLPPPSDKPAIILPTSTPEPLMCSSMIKCESRT